jgi:RND family efflux transporter MFP subunit
MRYTSTILAGSVFGCALALVGCTRVPSDPPTAAPIQVTVSYPVEREVTDYADFTARTAAVDSVEVRSHVWGYLKKINFKEGALVKQGDVLFEIDARPYQAVLDHAKAKVAQDEAQLAFDEAEYQRNSKLITKGGVSRSDLEKSDAARHVDLANIAADKAVVASRELDLQYTKVTAPIAGRVSRYVVTVGNLVQSGDQANMTLLTTIVSVDPIYAYFDVDERTVQRARQWLRNGQAEPSADKGPSPDKRSSPVLGLAVDAGLPVALGLATEDGFPHRGTINFVDNQLNPKTGTLRVRGVFPNKDEMLTTGFFASVRLPISAPHRALLVTDRAIDSDQGQKILYVVNDKNEVLSRPVRVGSLHDGMRAIEDGLKPGERVVVNGLQTVRSGITVEPKLEDMPMSGPESEDQNPRQIQVSKSP